MKPVVIEDFVWCGANVTILPGVKIGEGAIVGAGSVVVKDVPKYAVVAGNPARVISHYNFDTQRWEKWFDVNKNKELVNGKGDSELCKSIDCVDDNKLSWLFGCCNTGTLRISLLLKPLTYHSKQYILTYQFH